MAKSSSNLSFILKVFSLLAILMFGIINQDSSETELKSENLIKVDPDVNLENAVRPVKNASLSPEKH